MNWEAIGAIGEILGAIGVIVTLAYLAVQIRQNTQVTRASTAQQMTDNWVSINLFIAQNGELVARSLTDPELTPGEIHSVLGYWRSLFHQWSNNHYQYSQGVLDDELFQPTVREISAIASGGEIGETMRSAWAAARYIYNDEFRAFMDKLISKDKVSTAS